MLSFFAEICGFVICRLAHLRNVRISDSGISLRIWRFGICGLKKKFAFPALIECPECLNFVDACNMLKVVMNEK